MDKQETIDKILSDHAIRYNHAEFNEHEHETDEEREDLRIQLQDVESTLFYDPDRTVEVTVRHTRPNFHVIHTVWDKKNMRINPRCVSGLPLNTDETDKGSPS